MPLKFQPDQFTLAPGRVCGKGYSQTDRHTYTHKRGVQKPLFSTFWRLYISNLALSQTWLFARCQYFHLHGSKKKPGLKQANTSMSHESLFQPFFYNWASFYAYKDGENMTFRECPTLEHLSHFENTKYFTTPIFFIIFANTRIAKKNVY